jgi:hypothetical protein
MPVTEIPIASLCTEQSRFKYAGTHEVLFSPNCSQPTIPNHKEANWYTKAVSQVHSIVA